MKIFRGQLRWVIAHLGEQVIAIVCCPCICLLQRESMMPPVQMHAGRSEGIRKQAEIGCAISYADEYKPGWRQKHDNLLVHLLLKFCKDGTISEGNVTDEAWLRIQNDLQNSTNCSFQIDSLKERLHDYTQLHSLLAETSSPIFDWDRENKFITIEDPDWRKHHPELLLCGEYIPYFDTLKEVFVLLNTKRSSEQQVSETSTNINNEKLVHQDIPQLSSTTTKFHKSRQSLKQWLTCMT